MNNTFVSLLGDAKTRLVAFLLAARLFVRLAIQSARSASTGLSGAYASLLRFLDASIFPAVVRYATHPLVILATILLLFPLILDASNTSLSLALGNYTNVCSAAVSSIVLMQSLKHHRDNTRMHDQHAREIAKLHEKLDDLTSRR